MAMDEVEDEPLFCERAAGIDIGKATVMVTIRVPSEARKGGRQQETREFGTTRRELLALADWLRCWQVEKAGMESTLVTGSRCTSCWSGRGSTTPCTRRRRSRRCPGGRRPTSWTPPGGEDHRAGIAGRVLRAAGGDPQAPHAHPLPQEAGPDADRAEGALREAAGGRAPEALVGDQRHP